MLDGEGTLFLYDLVHTIVGVWKTVRALQADTTRFARTKVSLDLGEGNDGAVSASNAVRTTSERWNVSEDGMLYTRTCPCGRAWARSR